MQRINMVFSRFLLLFAMLFSLGWSGSSIAASNTSASLVGTWYSANGKSITFKRNSTVTYHGKRYYYAVSSGGFIQLKGKHGDKTIPFLLSKGKLTLTEGGEATVYRRKR
jgi:hypothetical protein